MLTIQARRAFFQLYLPSLLMPLGAGMIVPAGFISDRLGRKWGCAPPALLSAFLLIVVAKESLPRIRNKRK